MDLRWLRKEIEKKYGDIDRKSGPLFLLAVLFEEVGELAEVVRKGEREKIEEELADVLFVLLSLANYFEVSPEEVLVKKYVEGDPSAGWDLP
ncbi:MAG: MazG nucleotide pyrophosphohydrolase domain-containing protein [Archaeoglobaceae archaeon]